MQTVISYKMHYIISFGFNNAPSNFISLEIVLLLFHYNIFWNKLSLLDSFSDRYEPFTKKFKKKGKSTKTQKSHRVVKKTKNIA